MNNTRNIHVDHAEAPDWIPSPQYDPVGYSYYDDLHEQRKEKRHERQISWRVLLLGFVMLMTVTLLSCAITRSFVLYRYDTDESFRNIVNTGMNVATAVLFLAIATTFVILVGLVWSLTIKAGIIKLPGGMLAHIIDLVVDWRRTGSRTIAQWSIDQHFGVQTILAEKSIYRNVTTYSPSMHYDYRNDMELGQGTTGTSISIPTFNELMTSGQIGGDSGVVLGIGTDDE